MNYDHCDYFVLAQMALMTGILVWLHDAVCCSGCLGGCCSTCTEVCAVCLHRWWILLIKPSWNSRFCTFIMPTPHMDMKGLPAPCYFSEDGHSLCEVLNIFLSCKILPRCKLFQLKFFIWNYCPCSGIQSLLDFIVETNRYCFLICSYAPFYCFSFPTLLQGQVPSHESAILPDQYGQWLGLCNLFISDAMLIY